MRKIQLILVCIIILSCIKPAGISEMYPIIDVYLYNYLALLCGGIIIPLTLVSSKKTSPPFLILLIYIVYISIITFFGNNELTFQYIKSWFYSLILICLFELLKNRLVLLLRVSLLVLEFLTIANLYFMILFPDGAYTAEIGYTDCWLLGYKSSFQYYFFPLLLFAFIFYHYNRELLNLIFVLFLIHVETILSWNVMFLIVLLLIDLAICFDLIKYKVFSIRIYILSVLLINIMFVFLYTDMLKQNATAFFFTSILGKDESMMSRMIMWDMALKKIPENLLLGVGYINSNVMYRIAKLSQPHLHNQILMLIYTGGIVGTSIFMLFLKTIIGKLHRYYNLYTAKLISFFIFALFVSVVVEVFTTGGSMMIWPIFFMGYRVKSLNEQFKCHFHSNCHIKCC